MNRGVRRLDADIDALCRRASRLRAEGLPVPGEMGPETLAAWLGAPRFRGGEFAARARRPGAALSLVATDDGSGEVLLVEAACLPGRGKLQVTGAVGPMMRESAEVAMTWVRSQAKRLCGAARLDDSTDVHVHPRRSGQVEGRPVRGGDAGRRPGLGADRPGGAGRRGHERRAHARGHGRAGERHHGEGAGGVPGAGDHDVGAAPPREHRPSSSRRPALRGRSGCGGASPGRCWRSGRRWTRRCGPGPSARGC